VFIWKSITKKIQEIISLRKEGWGDSEDGSMTTIQSNYYSCGNNENDTTEIYILLNRQKLKRT